MKTKYQLKIKSLNKESLSLYTKFLEQVFSKTNIEYNIFNFPTTVKRVTLLKSPHVYKSAREQFEIKRYSCILKFSISDKNSIEKIVLLNKPNVVTLSLKKL
jgi:ribosomal protein S10